jgi:hypothetical protein
MSHIIGLVFFALAVAALISLVSVDSLAAKIVLAAIAVLYTAAFTLWHAPSNESK